jgi:hypothetical protein
MLRRVRELEEQKDLHDFYKSAEDTDPAWHVESLRGNRGTTYQKVENCPYRGSAMNQKRAPFVNRALRACNRTPSMPRIRLPNCRRHERSPALGLNARQKVDSLADYSCHPIPLEE